MEGGHSFFFCNKKEKKWGGGGNGTGLNCRKKMSEAWVEKMCSLSYFPPSWLFFVWNVLFLFLIGRVWSGGGGSSFCCEAQRKGVKIRGDRWPLRSTPTPRVGFGIHNQLILNAARCSSVFLGSLTVARASSWSDASSVRLGSTAELSGGYREASHRYTR